MKNRLLAFTLLIILQGAFAQPSKNKSKVNPPALSSINEQSLRTDLFTLADAHFRGRSAGTIDELKAAAWTAKRMAEEGFEPAGDDGTYFQFFSLIRTRISPNSFIRIGEETIPLWKDALITQIAPAEVNAPIVFIGDAGKSDLSTSGYPGKGRCGSGSPGWYQLKCISS